MTLKTTLHALERVKEIAPGYYTERDGGDWYIVTPDHSSRVGEDFKSRDDARRCLLWLAGDPMPAGWRITLSNDLACDLDCGQGYPATIWKRTVAKAFPDRIADLQLV